MTQYQHHPERQPWHHLPDGFADYLDLEARLSTSVRDAALDRAAHVLDVLPSHMVDLGSGTGADAVALARRFPAARVHALDVSAELLDRVGSAAAEAGVADRVEEHHADLNNDWSAQIPPEADLVWAGLSLHHLDDPATVLRRVFSSLRPGGAIVMIEFSGEARFAPEDLGSGRAGLQDRIRAALSHGAHAHTDWSALLAEAGFASVEQHEHEFVARADTSDGAQYLEKQLRAQRDRLSDEISSDDLVGLNAVIDALQTGTSEISFRSGRGVWTAVRPLAETHGGQSEDIDADVAVVGGGAAGLAASIVLARSRRRVVVIDEGHPRNAPAEGAHNVLGHEGIPPQELLAKGRAEAESYGARIVQGQVTRLSGEIDDFAVEVGGGVRRVRARRIILATGLVDGLPDIPGVEQGWGRTVLHCPFCHGWEVRDQRIAILTRDEVAIHHAMLFRQLSDRVTVFLH